ncbi:hypothetical protein ACFV0R_18780 [Streptomyces sp. NPDC059578]|uniref:hypothetical protein n=1 Tax=unclassified Streptomyces TaxID=2593676 RepID=UPI0036481AA5
MKEAGEAKAAESDEETLTRLTSAIGQPPLSMLDNAKALFALHHGGNEDPSAESVSAERAAAADQVCG